MLDYSRRILLKVATLAAISFSPLLRLARATAPGNNGNSQRSRLSQPLGVEDDGLSHVYHVNNGSPEENMKKAVEMMGGIDRIVGPLDIVVLKPNAQWWNQGMTNTDAMKAFIDMVLGIRDFSGEVIIGENHQFDEDNSRGWTTQEKNGTYNYNELIQYYQTNGYKNVTKSHWHVAGRTNLPLEGDAQGKSRVNGPQDGEGYVWMDDEYYFSPDGRKCLMTYPVFLSVYSGITIDLKNGAWKDGDYLSDRKIRFINFSALNHHGIYSGVTAAVKNLMGVVDMSCGFPGDAPAGTFNTHHIGVSKFIRWKKNKLFMRLTSRLGLEGVFIDFCYQDFHCTGGALGHFMRHVQMPDLNVITAEQVGWGSRIDLKKSFHAKAVLAGKDPVALDYIAARDVLLPATPPDALNYFGLPYYELNDPENKDGPFYRFLKETEKQGIGNLDQGKIKIHKADLQHA